MEILSATPEVWDRAVETVLGGGLVVFPTDTVYGVGCNPYDVHAIQRVYEAKGRPESKALPLLVSDEEQLAKVSSSVPYSARALGAAFWPGALTLVIPRSDDLPQELGSGDTIAVRIPDHDGLRGFIRCCGGAIAATSANLSGQPDALEAIVAARYLGDAVQLVIDGGKVGGGIPSTVVDCTADPPAVLREGAISEEAIIRVFASQSPWPSANSV